MTLCRWERLTGTTVLLIRLSDAVRQQASETPKLIGLMKGIPCDARLTVADEQRRVASLKHGLRHNLAIGQVLLSLDCQSA